jgi:hypothetical protein
MSQGPFGRDGAAVANVVPITVSAAINARLIFMFISILYLARYEKRHFEKTFTLASCIVTKKEDSANVLANIVESSAETRALI